MSNLREAAQQALEALDSDNQDIQLRAAVALRAALAQPEPAATTTADFPSVIDAKKEAIGQLGYYRKMMSTEAAPTVVGPDVPEISCGDMEPVAWMWHNKKTGARGVYFDDPAQFFALPANGDYEWTSLVAAHPPRTALSDAELACLYIKHARCQEEGPITSGWFDFARAVEAAIKEKQND